MKITDMCPRRLFQWPQDLGYIYEYRETITNDKHEIVGVNARSVALLHDGEWILSIGDDTQWNPYVEVQPLKLA